MNLRLRCLIRTGLALLAAAGACTIGFAQDSAVGWQRRMDRIEADLTLAEDMRAIKRLQRVYGYYLDEGMWSDLADLFADDAIARYPAGTFIGQDSIRRHVHLNVGGVELGQNGLGDGRLYNHMTFGPVAHIDEGGRSARGRWRVLATIGSAGGAAVWAEGAYEMVYTKLGGFWRIQELTYQI